MEKGDHAELPVLEESVLKTVFGDSVARMIEFAKLHLSLSAGAIVAIAVFFREPAPFPWTKWLVASALLLFLVAFGAFHREWNRLVTIEFALTILRDKDATKTLPRLLPRLQRMERIGGWAFNGGLFLMFLFALLLVVRWP